MLWVIISLIVIFSGACIFTLLMKLGDVLFGPLDYHEVERKRDNLNQ